MFNVTMMRYSYYAKAFQYKLFIKKHAKRLCDVHELLYL